MKQTIDAKGWDCPKPIIETKKLLDTMREGNVITIVDNRIAVENLISLAQSLGHEVTCTEEDGVFYVEVSKEYSELDKDVKSPKDLVIQISSNQYGVGSVELSENLMKAYIYALTEVDPKPKTLLFINTGVYLTTEGSPVLESLNVLEEAGTEILSCGACLDFYGLAESLKVGSVTNMYTMVEKLNNAGNAIKV